MTEPTTAAGRDYLAFMFPAFEGHDYPSRDVARKTILAIEAEAREGMVDEVDCAHSQKVACEKARAAALDKARAAVQDAQKALGSFLWLGNNLHNSGTDTFREMYRAALEDATRGYQALAAIDALREDAER